MRRAVLVFALFAAVAVVVGAYVTPDTPVRPALAMSATDGSPVLVVLHGNNETGAERGAKWRDAATRNGWKVLALDCPRELGCNEEGQWYMWNGSAQWVFDQVRALAKRERIDMSRIYLAGWSGGATFIGKQMAEWPKVFAAVVIHGGGVPPRTGQCPGRPVPTYFLVGDDNPAHGAAKRLREYLDECRQRVHWELLPGANHGAEDAALTPAKADAILRWLSTHRRIDAWS